MTTGALTVVGPTELSEIHVWDAFRRPVASAAGRLETTVPVGIYQVEVRVVGRTREDLVAVRSTGPSVVDSADLTADSVVPLPHVASVDGRQAALAADLAATPRPDDPSADSRIVFFTRSAGGLPRLRRPLVWLLRLDGSVVRRLDTDGVLDRLHGGAGFVADVPAGTYLLAQHVEGLGPRAQTVVLAPSWETQVFTPWDSAGPALPQALVCLRPLGSGLDAASAARYAFTEAALDGLARGRPVLRSWPDGRRDGPRTDPVGRVATAYRQLLDADVGPGWLLGLAEEVGQWFPADAVALRLAVAERRGTRLPAERISDPPMFAAGIDAVFDVSRDQRPALAGGPFGRLLDAATGSALWSRWDLVAALGDRVPEELRALDVADASPVGAAAERRQVTVSPLGSTEPALAAAEPDRVRLGVGRYVDFDVRDVDEPGVVVAEVRVRVGHRILLYRRSGTVELRYVPTGRRLPHGPREAIEIRLGEGGDLAEHLRRYLHIERDA